VSDTQDYGVRAARSFDGDSIEAQDVPRLIRMQDRVQGFMADGRWYLPEDVRKGLGLPEGTAITSRIRDLRKRRFGGFTVERRRDADGSGRFEYRLLFPHREAAERRQEEK
jgi:hypothetical protein